MRLQNVSEFLGAVALCLCLAAGLSTGGASAQTPGETEAAEDPVGEYCRRGGDRSDLFDCACIASKAGEIRTQMSAGAAEKNSRQIDRAYERIDKLETMKAERPELAEAYDSKIANEHTKIEMLSNPDPMAYGNGVIMKAFDDRPDCRNHEGAYKSSFDGCMTTASDEEGEAYCSCVAGKVADAWTGAEVITSSQLRNKGVSARRACSG